MRSGPAPSKRTLLLLCTLVSFSGSCETGTFNPWLSPAQVKVEGECDVFTGRIVADDWAGRPIKTKHGVRYRAPTRPIRLPATLRLVVAETWQPGTCPDVAKLQEIPEDADFIRAGARFFDDRRKRNAVGAEFVGIDIHLVLLDE